MSVRFELIRPWEYRTTGQDDLENTVSFEQQKSWLDQYYLIREECFRRELGIRSFDGSEDEFDRNGYVLIVLDGDRCIGGARLSVSTPEFPALLPLEIDDFMILKLFPEIAMKGLSYCQWTRLALQPQYRTTDMLRNMGLALIQAGGALGCSYSFNVAGMNRARLYQRLHKNLGFNYEILSDIKVPADDGFMGLEHLLSIGYLDPHSRQQSLRNNGAGLPRNGSSRLRSARLRRVA